MTVTMTATGTATVTDIVGGLVTAYQGNEWTLVVAGVLMLLIAGVKPFLKVLPKKYLPWGVVAVAVISAIAVGLQTGQTWLTILTSGIVVGVAAVGGWETVGQLVRGVIRKLFVKEEGP